MLHILLQPCYKDSLTIYVNEMNMTSLTTLTPVCTVYLDIRYLAWPLTTTHRGLWTLEKCARWYNDDLDIPNKIEYKYVLESWVDTKHTSVILHCSLLGERFVMTSASVTFFCYPAPLTSAMKLVDAAILEQYQCVLARQDEGKNYVRKTGASSSEL